MSRTLRMRNATGQNVRVEVTDEAAAVLAHEGRQKRRSEILELAREIDPEPGDEQVRRRMKEAGETYDLAAQYVYTAWEERQERRERQLADPAPTELTDEAIRERVARTGESYDAAALALSVELEGGAA